jgi:hypothetical protein
VLAAAPGAPQCNRAAFAQHVSPPAARSARPRHHLDSLAIPSPGRARAQLWGRPARAGSEAAEHDEWGHPQRAARPSPWVGCTRRAATRVPEE